MGCCVCNKHPVILVVRPKGASLTIAAQVQGNAFFPEKKPACRHFAQWLFGKDGAVACTDAGGTDRAAGCWFFLPYVEDASFESRHLGLVTAQEVGALSEKVDRLADAFYNMLIWSRCCGSQRQRTACQRQ